MFLCVSTKTYRRKDVALKTINDLIIVLILSALILGSAWFASAQETVTGGSLTGLSEVPPATLNLTSEGVSDWVHWGLGSSTNIHRKASVSKKISNYTRLGTNYPVRFGDARVAYSWSDGTPTVSLSGTKTGIYFSGAGNGYQITVPADTTEKTFKIYLGSAKARGRLEASLSDGSVSPYVTFVENLTGAIDRVVTIKYRAATKPASLIVKYTLEGSSGNITLQAATLSQEVGGGQQVLPPDTEIKVTLTPSTDTRVTGHKLYWANDITSDIKNVDMKDQVSYVFPKGTFTNNTIYKFTATAYGLVNGELKESEHCAPYYLHIKTVMPDDPPITGPHILKIDIRIEAVQP